MSKFARTNVQASAFARRSSGRAWQHYRQLLIDAWSARRGAAKWAFVLPNQAGRAMAETALNHLSLNEVEARRFLTESEAREWLREKKNPAEHPTLSTTTAA